RKLTASPAIPGITSARAIRRLRRFVRFSCSPLARYGPVPRTSASVWVAVIASLLEALGQHQGVLGAPGDGRPVSLREVVGAAREALGREERFADAHGVAHGIARVAQRLHDAVEAVGSGDDRCRRQPMRADQQGALTPQAWLADGGED